MDVFLNPGLIHILEKIYFYLDFESLDNCALLNKSFAIMLTDPRFWYKKCLQKGHDYVKIWQGLIQSIDENKLAREEFSQVLKATFIGRKHILGIGQFTQNDPATILVKSEKFEFAEFVFEKLYPQENEKSRVALLFWATRDLTNEHFILTKYLLTKYKDVNIIPQNIWKKFIDFIWKRIFEENIDFFKDWMASVKDPFYIDEVREFTVHFAAKNGCINILKVMATMVGDLNFQNSGGFTPLQMASIYGHENVVEFLTSQCEILSLKEVEASTKNTSKWQFWKYIKIKPCW